ncbi:MAG: hypothetical protein J6S85_07365 [Methanobrevibacter sp.]|nr:hypothetical protein [Methanobrevibacter sp.]
MKFFIFHVVLDFHHLSSVHFSANIVAAFCLSLSQSQLYQSNISSSLILIKSLWLIRLSPHSNSIYTSHHFHDLSTNLAYHLPHFCFNDHSVSLSALSKLYIIAVCFPFAILSISYSAPHCSDTYLKNAVTIVVFQAHAIPGTANTLDLSS